MKTDAAQEIQARLIQLNGMITLDANGNPIVAYPAYQSLMSDLNDSIKGSSGTTQTKLPQLKDNAAPADGVWHGAGRCGAVAATEPLVCEWQGYPGRDGRGGCETCCGRYLAAATTRRHQQLDGPRRLCEGLWRSERPGTSRSERPASASGQRLTTGHSD